MTTEELKQHISAAYDSVDLIDQLNRSAKLLSIDDKDTKVRNIKHLKIMIAKDWFADGLTPEQTAQINALII